MSGRSEPSASSRKPLQDLEREASTAAGKVKSEDSKARGTSREGMEQVTEEAQAKGTELLGQAQERAEDVVDQGKAAGAERASGFARAIHHAADDLEGSSPDIARHVRAAADSLNGISDALRDRSAGQLLEDVTDFARRQPTLFFGAAAIAGFALVRFARSSASGGRTASRKPTASTAPGWTRNAPGEAPRPATMSGATLGGAVAYREGQVEPARMPVAPTGSVQTPRSTGREGQGGTIPDQTSETPL